MTDIATARRVMVDNQIRTFDVTDRDVLAAFDVVPRHLFVEPQDRELAYLDRRMAVGGRALLEPLILARLIQALQPQAGERALDICGAYGYSAAIFAAMGLTTSALETDAALCDGAKAAMAAANAKVTILPTQPALDAKSGAKLNETFDILLVNGASEQDPSGFFSLMNEGARLGIIRRKGRAAQATIYLKANGVVSSRFAFDAQGVILPGFAAAADFVF